MSNAQNRAIAGGIQEHSVGETYPFHPVGIANGDLINWQVHNLQTGEVLSIDGAPGNWAVAESAIYWAARASDWAAIGRVPTGRWRWTKPESAFDRILREKREAREAQHQAAFDKMVREFSATGLADVIDELVREFSLTSRQRADLTRGEAKGYALRAEYVAANESITAGTQADWKDTSVYDDNLPVWWGAD
jgi:hypothetical protein